MERVLYTTVLIFVAIISVFKFKDIETEICLQRYFTSTFYIILVISLSHHNFMMNSFILVGMLHEN